jgi:nucleoside-diphosphate-sugar epimerase
MRKRSVSITGATGFVGWRLAEAFRDAGWAVRGVSRPGRSRPLPPGIERIEAALDGDALARAVDGSDLLVHAAGLVRAAHDEAFDRVNVQGTSAAVAAANRSGAALMLISSQAAAGPAPPERPAREDDGPRPITAYGRSKLAAEQIVRRAARVPWTILRPCAVYGPRDRGFLPLFRMASRGIFVLVTPPGTSFTLVHVDDLARAVIAAAGAPGALRETLFVGGARPHTTADVLRSLARAFDCRYRPFSLPRAVLGGAAAAGDLCWRVGLTPPIDRSRLAELSAEGFVCCVDRARDVLGFTAAVPLEDGMAATARWYAAHRWL